MSGLPPPNPEMDHHDDHEPAERTAARRKVLDEDTARAVFEFRDRAFPLGFRNVDELLGVEAFKVGHLDILKSLFSNAVYGSWSVFPQPIPRRGPGGYDGVVHAALLHTGKVLFITADETTLLWNPHDTTAATFEDPVNQPHLTPNAASGYSVLCGGHSFLSDGRLLVAGGGGYGPHAKAMWGYKFDPTTKTGREPRQHGARPLVPDRSHAGRRAHRRQPRGPGRLRARRRRHGDLRRGHRQLPRGDVGRRQAVPEPLSRPSPVAGQQRLLLEDRLGERRARAAVRSSGDDQSAYFVLTGASTGAWTDIAPVTPSMPDRTKGMSVMLLSDTAPQVRIMVLGGSDSSNNNTYEIIDATSLSPATNWGTSTPFPDGERRSLASAVLLPDGTVFVCGGIQRPTRPARCSIPRTTRGPRWRRCPRSATTTRSRCCCRAGRWRWRDGTTPRSRSSTRPTYTAERGR